MMRAMHADLQGTALLLLEEVVKQPGPTPDVIQAAT